MAGRGESHIGHFLVCMSGRYNQQSLISAPRVNIACWKLTRIDVNVTLLFLVLCPNVTSTCLDSRPFAVDYQQPMRHHKGITSRSGKFSTTDEAFL